MVRITRKLKKMKGAYKEASHMNLAGAPSFSMPLELAIVHEYMYPNMFGDTYYMNQFQVQEQTFELSKLALEKMPEHLAKVAIYARNDGYARTKPQLGVCAISTLEDKKFLKSMFNRVVLIPKDGAQLIDFCKTGRLREGVGTTIDKCFHDWFIHNKSRLEYWSVKYPTEMQEIVKTCHLNFPDDPYLQTIVAYIMDFKWERKYNEITDEQITERLTQFPQITAWEKLKRATDARTILNCIKEGRLPHDVVTGVIKPEADGWKELAYQMPNRALLNKLATFLRNGLYNDPEFVEYIYKRLTNAEAMNKSKIYPFRYFTAKNVTGANLPARINDALDIAMENAFITLPPLAEELKICIGVDTSGSMGGTPQMYWQTKRRGEDSITNQTRYIDLAGIFTGALLKMKKENVIVVPFDTEPHFFDTSEYDTIMDVVNAIRKYGGGGTNIGIPIRYLMYEYEYTTYKQRQLFTSSYYNRSELIEKGKRSEPIFVDCFIGITDSEDWHGYSYGSGIAAELAEYRKVVNPNLEAFMIRIDPYSKDASVSKSDPKNHHISGWSDKIPNLIADILKGNDDQLEKIKKIEL